MRRSNALPVPFFWGLSGWTSQSTPRTWVYQKGLWNTLMGSRELRAPIDQEECVPKRSLVNYSLFDPKS
jgi:hypothetical protein